MYRISTAIGNETYESAEFSILPFKKPEDFLEHIEYNKPEVLILDGILFNIWKINEVSQITVQYNMYSPFIPTPQLPKLEYVIHVMLSRSGFIRLIINVEIDKYDDAVKSFESICAAADARKLLPATVSECLAVKCSPGVWRTFFRTLFDSVGKRICEYDMWSYFGTEEDTVKEAFDITGLPEICLERWKIQISITK